MKKISRLCIVYGAMFFYVLGLFYVEVNVADATAGNLSYPIVDTGQVRFYDNTVETKSPKKGERFFGQDANYKGNTPDYKDNEDGTITDLVTGLTWQQDPGEKKTFREAVKGAAKCRTGGFTDWRLPTVKELYSLINFSGIDPSVKSSDTLRLKPFIDTHFFNFKYGNPYNPEVAERIIDSQFATSTKYVHKTMNGNDTMFGVNFADGRIKGYPVMNPRGRGYKTFHVLYVRGTKDYGKNKFVNNSDGTITDKATGLTWMQVDSGHLNAGNNKDGKLNWQEALEWSGDLSYADHSDWRLPNAKELQSIVDYSRSPATTNSPAISTVFHASSIEENGQDDYPYYWSSTTHKRDLGGKAAVYLSFGKGYGWMKDRRTGKKSLMDVHGAGSQRSDPKSGDPTLVPYGRGPQGDVLRINNFVRCVRGGIATSISSGPKIEKKLNRGKRSQGGGRFVKRLDKNGDGMVAKGEFDGPSKHFNRLDKNGDGFLSEDESPQGPPTKGARKP
ncbi:MAG: DUF1566 domain-containing protein [Desulfotalea sp.]